MYYLHTKGLETNPEWRPCDLIEWKSMSQAIVFCPPFGHVFTKIEYLGTNDIIWPES